MKEMTLFWFLFFIFKFNKANLDFCFPCDRYGRWGACRVMLWGISLKNPCDSKVV